MDPVDRALSVLSQAERQLRQLVSDAAGAGDYAGVVRIASWARELTAILDESEPSGRYSRRRVRSTPQHSAPAPSPIAANVAAKLGPKGYPRFHREGERLVRVAWSKRDRSEYEHKAPQSLLETLAARVSEAGTDGKVFAIEELLPIQDRDGNAVPAYQVYVVLALFKQVGLIDQHGRRGYSVPKPKGLANAVEAAWRNLPGK